MFVGRDGITAAQLTSALCSPRTFRARLLVSREPRPFLGTGFDFRAFSGDGGNRTHVRGRVKDGVYERSRRSCLAPRLPRRQGSGEPASLKVPAAQEARAVGLARF